MFNSLKVGSGGGGDHYLPSVRMPPHRFSTASPIAMDEGTIKTPIPKCRLYWCFCLEGGSNFVGSESGQKQSVKLLQNMVYNTTQHPPPPPPQPHTVWIYNVRLLLGRGKGWGRSERRYCWGATVHKRGQIYQHDWLYLQSISSIKH
jgi:hypothetical protein